MTKTKKKIVVIAPYPLLTAFQILISSAPSLDLLAAEVSLSAVCDKTEEKPDIVLAYFERGHLPKGPEFICSKKIEDLKGAWPGVYIIAVTSDPQWHEEIRKSGADKVLFEGIPPAYLLASIEMIELQSNV